MHGQNTTRDPTPCQVESTSFVATNELFAKSFSGNRLAVAYKANVLLKRNIDALLKARGHTQRDLADWCHRTEEWLSKALRDDKRGIPVKYFDRMADFFGIEAYQLLAPGMSALSERRSGIERRTMIERRVGRSGLMKPKMAASVSNHTALVQLISYLTDDEALDLVKTIGEQLRGRLSPRAPSSGAAGRVSGGKTRAPTVGKAKRAPLVARDEAGAAQARTSS